MATLYYTTGTAGTATTVWNIWTNESNCTTTTNGVWSTWCQGVTSTASTTSTIATQVWCSWNVSGSGSTAPAQLQQVHAPELTEEQRQAQEAERLRRQEEALRRREEEVKQREAAVAKAELLLSECLAPDQWEELKAKGHFHVTAPSGARFRISRGWAGNVVELGADDKPVRRFCIHPSEFIPEGDNILAQKLLLETDEQQFRRIANATELRQAA